MRRFLRIAVIATALTSALAATTAPVDAAMPAVDLDDNPLTNPWGYTDGQVVTYRQAQEVLIYELNWERTARGLQPVAISYDNATAECNNTLIVRNGWSVWPHYAECHPEGYYAMEAVHGNGFIGSPTPQLWAWRNSQGHNFTIFNSEVDTARIALTCATIDGVPQQVTTVQLYDPSDWYSPFTVEATPSAFDTSTAHPPFGAGCDSDRNYRFHYWRDQDLAVNEAAPSPAAPELWHRFQVARLYSAYFQRLPDTGGWAYWNQRSINGDTMYRISEFFEDSQEFKTTYGPKLSDAEFITLVYSNVLDRNPEPDGFEFWNTQMAEGMSRAEVMVHFSESAEYIAKIAPFITGEYWNGDVQSSYLAAAPHTPRPAIPG